MIYRLNAIPIKITARFIIDYMSSYKIDRKGTGPREAKTILTNKNKLEGLTLSDINVHYTATVIRQYGSGGGTDT